MAGLSVLLESQNNNTTNFPKRPQILCKTTILRNPSLFSPSLPTSPFLEHCYLCRRRLVEGKDIYMYRGDRAFCSVECRCRQMYMDEAATAAAGEGGRRREGFGVLGM